MLFKASKIRGIKIIFLTHALRYYTILCHAGAKTAKHSSYRVFHGDLFGPKKTIRSYIIINADFLRKYLINHLFIKSSLVHHFINLGKV